MTAATLSRLPISAGGAAAASLARGVYWVLNRLIDFGYFAVAQFMRAPVAISTIVAIVGFSLLAGGNALYFQSSRHPAPLFFAPRHVSPAPAARPVIPATRHPQAAIDEETTGSLGTTPAVETINNADVMMLQRKLAALKFFDGTPDGIFGRRTASAIKTFEIKAGLKPRGKLTRELLATVLAAPVPEAPVSVPASTALADIAPTSRPAVAARPASMAATASAPVPLAPLPRTVSVIHVANAAPVPPADTFSANSLPADDSAAATPAAATAAEPSAPAPQPLASVSAVPPANEPVSNDPADTGSVVAMNSLPPDKATLPAAQAATPAATQQVATAQASPANVPQESATPVATASGNTAPLTPAQKLAAQMGTLPPGATVAGTAPATVVANTGTSSDPGDDAGSTDPVLITKIQRGLASLGFLAQKIDGVPGEGTAKAIRNFEVFYDYRVTGLATPQLLNLLVQHGAQV